MRTNLPTTLDQNERNRRNQILRIGFTVCVFLVFLSGESRTKKFDAGGAASNMETVGKIPTSSKSSYTHLNNFSQLNTIIAGYYQSPSSSTSSSSSSYSALSYSLYASNFSGNYYCRFKSFLPLSKSIARPAFKSNAAIAPSRADSRDIIMDSVSLSNTSNDENSGEESVADKASHNASGIKAPLRVANSSNSRRVSSSLATAPTNKPLPVIHSNSYLLLLQIMPQQPQPSIIEVMSSSPFGSSGHSRSPHGIQGIAYVYGNLKFTVHDSSSATIDFPTYDKNLLMPVQGFVLKNKVILFACVYPNQRLYLKYYASSGGSRSKRSSRNRKSRALHNNISTSSVKYDSFQSQSLPLKMPPPSIASSSTTTGNGSKTSFSFYIEEELIPGLLYAVISNQNLSLTPSSDSSNPIRNRASTLIPVDSNAFRHYLKSLPYTLLSNIPTLSRSSDTGDSRRDNDSDSQTNKAGNIEGGAREAPVIPPPPPPSSYASIPSSTILLMNCLLRKPFALHLRSSLQQTHSGAMREPTSDRHPVDSTNDATAAATAAAKYQPLLGSIQIPSCDMFANVTFVNHYIEKAKIESKAARYSTLACLFSVLHIVLLVAQIRYMQTDSIITKVSIVSVFLQCVLDAVISVAHFIFVPFVSRDSQSSSSSFLMVFLLNLIVFGVLEMRMLVWIYRSRFAQELATGGIRGFEQRLLQLNLRFLAAFVLGFTCLVYFFRSPVFLVFVFYSYLCPQVLWSVTSGTRRALDRAFLVGTALLRSYVPLYFLLCPQNLFFEIYFNSFSARDSSSLPSNASAMREQELKDSYYLAGCVLIVWLWTQVGLVLAQDMYGPRIFVPYGVFPVTYDYYRAVPANSSGSRPNTAPPAAAENRTTYLSNNSGNSFINEDPETSSSDSSSHKKECAICFNDINANIRRSYMVTPCDHQFHRDCLLQWLEMKLECPICRSALPPHEL